MAARDGFIKKPIGFCSIEKALSIFSAAPAAPSLWGKAEALERLGGDEELLRELCQIFLEESPKLLVKLREAIVKIDAPAVMRTAHSLKGELGYLSAAAASQAAQQLEDMGQKNNLFRAAETLVELEREIASLRLELTDSAGAIQ